MSINTQVQEAFCAAENSMPTSGMSIEHQEKLVKIARKAIGKTWDLCDELLMECEGFDEESSGRSYDSAMLVQLANAALFAAALIE